MPKREGLPGMAMRGVVRDFEFTFFQFLPASLISLAHGEPDASIQTLLWGETSVAILFARFSNHQVSTRLGGKEASAKRQGVCFAAAWDGRKPNISALDSRGPSATAAGRPRSFVEREYAPPIRHAHSSICIGF